MLKESDIEVLQPPDKSGFGLFPVRSSLTKGITYVFFSSGYLDISVPQVTFLRTSALDPLYFDSRGFPIRTPPDQSFVAAPRRLSRLSTSFIGQTNLGIHYLP
jgi:hypothetical protein